MIRLYDTIDTMLLALAIKQAGGTLLLEKKMFLEMDDDFEILITKNANEDAVLTLVDDEVEVTKIRAKRMSEQLKAERRKSLIVP